MVVLELLKLLLLELLELLVDLILLLNHLDDVVDLGLIQDLMHGCISEVPQQQRQSIQQYDVYVVIAQDFCLR